MIKGRVRNAKSAAAEDRHSVWDIKRKRSGNGIADLGWDWSIDGVCEREN